MKQTYSVAVLLFDHVNAIDVAGPLEAFSAVRTELGEPAYAIQSWALGEVIIRSESGLKLCADGRVPPRPAADILIIPGGAGIRDDNTLCSVSTWLKKNASRFARIVTVCTGAYALAEAGLLGGRRVTTHWMFASDLQKRYPNIRVEPDALFLRDGPYYSSGGVTAGIDLALDLIEQDFGRNAAMKAARELVVFLRRTGAQTQFSMPLKMQTVASDRLNDVCKWAASHLDSDLSVDVLASRAGLSSRQFSRRFHAAFGTPPATYIKRLRLDAGRSLLGQGAEITRAAQMAGFGSTDGFRRAFTSEFGVTPGEYQKRFSNKTSA